MVPDQSWPRSRHPTGAPPSPTSTVTVGEDSATIVGTVAAYAGTLVVPFQELPVNKRKKVALHKHRVKRKKLEEKRRLSGLARRK